MKPQSRFGHECAEPIAASQAIAMARANHSHESLSHPSFKLQIYDLQMRDSANIEHAAIAEENETLLKKVEEMNE